MKLQSKTDQPLDNLKIPRSIDPGFNEITSLGLK